MLMLLTPSGVAVLAAALTGCPAPTELPAPPANRPTYAMTVSIALDRPSDRIVFRLWPNMPVERLVGARLEVRNVRVGGADVATSEPDPTTLVLARPVAAAERVTVSMSWTLRLPRTPTERLASAFGVRLSSF